MKVLLPISLDRWRNPISTLLRACVEYNPDIEFHSFSNPVSDEDREQAERFWKLPNIRLRNPSAIVSDRFDIIHTASYSHGNYIASILSKLRGAGHTRYLDTMNLEPHPSFPDCWARYRRVLHWVDGFVAVSEAVAKDIRQRVPERFLGVIPNGFDSGFYDPNADYRTDLPERVRELPDGFPLWVATLEPRKHPEIFVQLAEANPDVPFVAIGGAIKEDELPFAELFKRTPNIHWLGSVNRSAGRAILSKAGVLVFPSEREGLSLAMIEAMAMGLPILAQPKSSMPELVSPGINGELLDANDFQSWNHGLRKWLKPHTGDLKRGLESTRLETVRRFKWSTVGEAYAPIYQQVAQLPARVLQPCPA